MRPTSRRNNTPQSFSFFWTGTLLSALCVCIVLFSLSGCSDSQSASTNIPVATSGPVHASTPTVAVTPTPTAIPVGPAILGGNIQAFIHRYGQPNGHSDVSNGFYDFQQYPGETVDFLIVSTDLGDGTAYANVALDIKVQASNNGSLDENVCKGFYPPDAQYQRQVTIIGGIDKIYFSASLAKAFPATSFLDANKNPVTPGYFNDTVLSNSDGTITVCDIAPGTQGTE